MERWGLEQQLRTNEAELKKKCAENKNKYQLKLVEIKKEIEIAREEGRMDAIQVQTDATRELADLKKLFHREKLHLKQQIGSPRASVEPPEPQEAQEPEPQRAPTPCSYTSEDITNMLHKSDILDIIDYHLDPVLRASE